VNPTHHASISGLWISPSVVFTKCDICGHLKQGTKPVDLGSNPMLVCPKCLELIINIQAHIFEYCKTGAKTHREIYEEMAGYGIPEDLTEKIRVWMTSTGELCDTVGR